MLNLPQYVADSTFDDIVFKFKGLGDSS